MLTTRAAAEKLGVTSSRVRQLIGQNRLKSVKAGRDHMVDEASLQEFKKCGPLKRGRPRINCLRMR